MRVQRIVGASLVAGLIGVGGIVLADGAAASDLTCHDTAGRSYLPGDQVSVGGRVLECRLGQTADGSSAWVDIGPALEGWAPPSHNPPAPLEP
ncbi:hypothetical protein [Actinomadura rupiterrae]|uniref:hypothetical protein n=1 Tax=Actinomadura rupiterrae TaxID=559627 RepID=UPI0020A2878C|nr:hypothetical protein [Actinomadura rupiterrae]MCP2339313.1 hypothetical protein [Actinomadura rupiterrae]